MALDRTQKWAAAFTDRGNVLTTEMNSLADGAWSASGPAYTNTTNLDQLGKVELNVTFGTAPAATGFVVIYMIEAPDGTNYDTIDTDNDPRADKQITQMNVIDTTNAQRRISPGLFIIPPGAVKFSLQDKAGQAFPASGSTLKLYTANAGLHS